MISHARHISSHRKPDAFKTSKTRRSRCSSKVTISFTRTPVGIVDVGATSHTRVPIIKPPFKHSKVLQPTQHLVHSTPASRRHRTRLRWTGWATRTRKKMRTCSRYERRWRTRDGVSNQAIHAGVSCAPATYSRSHSRSRSRSISHTPHPSDPSCPFLPGVLNTLICSLRPQGQPGDWEARS